MSRVPDRIKEISCKPEHLRIQGGHDWSSRIFDGASEKVKKAEEHTALVFADHAPGADNSNRVTTKSVDLKWTLNYTTIPEYRRRSSYRREKG